MPRMSRVEMLRQMLTFLHGLNSQEVREQLAPVGLDQAELEQGWSCFYQAARWRGAQALTCGNREAPQTLAELDRWENRWFPLIETALRARFPAVAQRVFLNLSRQSGKLVIISVMTLLSRLEALGTSGEEGQARQLLHKRGLTPAELQKAQTLCQRLREGGAQLLAQPTPAADPLDAAWTWHKEWTALARQSIPRKDLRVMLGLSERRRRAS